MKTSILVYIFIFIIIISCVSQKTDYVFNKLKTELDKKGLKIDSVDNIGLIYVTVQDIKLSISLDNLRKSYTESKDDNEIVEFANAIVTSVDEIGPWKECKDHIYTSYFPSDFEFKDNIHKKITDEFHQIFSLRINGKISWILPDQLKKWGIDTVELEKQADMNGNELLIKANIEFDTIEGKKIGYFSIGDGNDILKGSMLFASGFKEKVKAQFGFPVYAIFPVRDFLIFFSEKDFDFFSSRIGTTVKKEYNKSAYPITPELLKVSDKGVEAVGKYPVK